MRFSTWFASAILTFMAGTTWAQCDNLFFSEAAEGSSNNKYFEIYNPTGADVDLSGYAFPSVSNAPSVVPASTNSGTRFPKAPWWPRETFTSSRTPHQMPTILAEADHTFTFLSNGDDGFILVQGDETSFVQIDAVGDWNGDPGSGWDVAGVTAGTKDHTIVRKASVLSGNGGDWSASAGTDADNSEWIVLDQNDWSNLAFTPSTVVALAPLVARMPMRRTTMPLPRRTMALAFLTMHATSMVLWWRQAASSTTLPT